MSAVTEYIDAVAPNHIRHSCQGDEGGDNAQRNADDHKGCTRCTLMRVATLAAPLPAEQPSISELIATHQVPKAKRMAELCAEQPINPVSRKGDFQCGVIAALAVLNSHGFPHGSVYHDSIINTVGDSIYEFAEDEDYELAGLDPSKKPKIRARIVGQQTKGGGNG